MEQKIGNLHDNKFYFLGKKRESTSDKLNCAVNNFSVTCSSHIKWISGIVLCTLYWLDHCVFCSL